MLVITNDAGRIVATNYWESDAARRERVFCSTNAGVIRLLIPPGPFGDALTRDTRDATRAAVQLAGAWTTGVVHIVWEHPASPSSAVLSLDVAQCDRMLPVSEVGRWVPLAAYVRGDTTESAHLAHTWPALIRRATFQPDASPIPTPPVS